MSNENCKTFYFPDGNNSGVDPNLLLAMNNGGGFGGNNAIWIIFLLALFGRNGLGFGNNGFEGGGSINNYINNDQAKGALLQAINGNGAAINQLASTLHCDVNAIQTALNSVQSSICNVGNQVGMGTAQVINSLQQGNMTIAQQIAQCCCDNKLLSCQNQGALMSRIDQFANGVTQGFSATAYETAQQTCALQNSLRDQTLSIVNKLDAQESARKDREINALTAQLATVNARAERAAELGPIYKALDEIKAKQPSTATVQYPNLIGVPASQFYGYGYNNGAWS